MGERPGLVVLWGLYGLAWGLAPWLLTASYAQVLASQIGIAILSCLAYNLLLGQGGMLSFGHAIYGGAGAYAVIDALQTLQAHPPTGTAAPWIVAALPLWGALAGAGLAAGLGALCARHSGTAFGMITLGLGELVAAVAQMAPQVFGGEAGRSANRVLNASAWHFGPSSHLLMLVAGYTLAGTAALWALTRTPFGLLLGAVRDEPERLAFLGHSPAWVRWWALVLSGAVSGLAGGLAALLFERVSPEVFSGARSAALLLFVFVGGSAHFVGPMVGAVLMVLSLTVLASLTPAWPLYLGLVFLWMVWRAPHGLAGLLWDAHTALRAGRLRNLGRGLGRVGLGVAIAGGVVVAVEALYQRQFGA
jgi:branched-chain amino acid transport system permease protein